MIQVGNSFKLCAIGALSQVCSASTGNPIHPVHKVHPIHPNLPIHPIHWIHPIHPIHQLIYFIQFTQFIQYHTINQIHPFHPIYSIQPIYPVWRSVWRSWRSVLFFLTNRSSQWSFTYCFIHINLFIYFWIASFTFRGFSDIPLSWALILNIFFIPIFLRALTNQGFLLLQF